MAFREVSKTAIDIKRHKDVAYVGEYKGHRSIKTKIGDQTIYEFIGEDGIKFSIYGFTNLNRSMEMIAEGARCRITYLGTENVQTKFGMKDVHQVRVEVEEEDVMPTGEDTSSTLEPF